MFRRHFAPAVRPSKKKLKQKHHVVESITTYDHTVEFFSNAIAIYLSQTSNIRYQKSTAESRVMN